MGAAFVVACSLVSAGAMGGRATALAILSCFALWLSKGLQMLPPPGFSTTVVAIVRGGAILRAILGVPGVVGDDTPSGGVTPGMLSRWLELADNSGSGEEGQEGNSDVSDAEVQTANLVVLAATGLFYSHRG